MAYLEGWGIRKAFEVEGGAPTLALEEVTFSVGEGEFVAILGPSGCGKSTVLNIVAGFIRPTAGRILLEGREVAAPGSDRGVVFQEHALFPWMRVLENVTFGLRLKGVAPFAAPGAILVLYCLAGAVQAPSLLRPGDCLCAQEGVELSGDARLIEAVIRPV